MARTMSVPCRRDLACYRNDGHPGECMYPTSSGHVHKGEWCEACVQHGVTLAATPATMVALCGAVLTCALPILHDGDHERADGIRWTWPATPAPPVTLSHGQGSGNDTVILRNSLTIHATPAPLDVDCGDPFHKTAECPTCGLPDTGYDRGYRDALANPAPLSPIVITVCPHSVDTRFTHCLLCERATPAAYAEETP